MLNDGLALNLYIILADENAYFRYREAEKVDAVDENDIKIINIFDKMSESLESIANINLLRR